MNKAAHSGRTVLVAGATGLVGHELLRGLLSDDTVQAVHVLGRRVPTVHHPKLHTRVVNFGALPTLPPLDEAYLALGTTIKAAGSQTAFRAIDFDANLAVARAAIEAGARRIGLVSAMGADARSGIFYNRVKGELEEALSSLDLDALVIARPSLLLGDRAALGQAPRTAEGLGMHVGALLGPLIPRNYRPIAAARVAHALLARVPVASGKEILSSGAMRG